MNCLNNRLILFSRNGLVRIQYCFWNLKTMPKHTKQFFPTIFIHIGLIFPYGHNPIFECIYHTTIYYIPPKWLCQKLPITFNKMFYCPLSRFLLSNKDRYRMCHNTKNWSKEVLKNKKVSFKNYSSNSLLLVSIAVKADFIAWNSSIHLRV